MSEKEIVINTKELRAYYHLNYTIYAVGRYRMLPVHEEYPLSWMLYIYNGIIPKEDLLDDRLRLSNTRIGAIYYLHEKEVDSTSFKQSIFFLNKLKELNINPDPNMDVEKRVDIECEMLDEFVLKDLDQDKIMNIINKNIDLNQKLELEKEKNGYRYFPKKYTMVQNDDFKGHTFYYDGKTIIAVYNTSLYGGYPDAANITVYEGILGELLCDLESAADKKIGGFSFDFSGSPKGSEENVYVYLRKNELPDYLGTWQKMFITECEMIDRNFYKHY